MNPEVNDALFDFRMKFGSSEKLNLGTSKFGSDEFDQATRQRDKKMSKLEAGLVIAKYLKRLKLKKLGKMTQKPKEPINAFQNEKGQSFSGIVEASEDFSISSEKPLVQSSNDNTDSIRKIEQKPLVSTKASQVIAIGSSNLNKEINQRIYYQNNQDESETPNLIRTEEHEKSKLPQTKTFMKPSASNSYFNLFIGSSMKLRR